MKLLRGLHNPGLPEGGCVATIGNFDGVHRGHQAVLRKVKVKSLDMGLPSLAIIFEPQAQEFFRPDAAPARLMSFRQKFETLSELGLNYIFCLKFNDRLRNLTAEAFVSEILCRHLHIKHLVVGDDFRFGGDRRGDFEFLQGAGKAHGFSVENTESQLQGLERISSTALREVLASGDFPRANTMLGRPYTWSGRVVHGQALGRNLGFPTANIALKQKNSALNGVYCVKVLLPNGEQRPGVANVGRKPSAGQFDPNIEIHLLNYSGDLYGQRLKVEFINKVRDELKFNSLDALKAQIASDIEFAKNIFDLD